MWLDTKTYIHKYMKNISITKKLEYKDDYGKIKKKKLSN